MNDKNEPLLSRLRDDLVGWWHAALPQGVEGSRRWEVTDEDLPLALDDAATVFIEHVVCQITRHVRQEQALNSLVYVEQRVARLQPADVDEQTLAELRVLVGRISGHLDALKAAP